MSDLRTSAYQYRLHLTKVQQRLLEQQLEECRWVYNETLAARKQAYEQRGVSLRLYDTQAMLPDWKAVRKSLKLVHSQVLQNVQLRVDLAFKAFFRHDDKDLARAQRRLSEQPKGRPERTRRRKIVARIHERIANRRKNFAHQESRKLIKRFGITDDQETQLGKEHCGCCVGATRSIAEHRNAVAGAEQWSRSL